MGDDGSVSAIIDIYDEEIPKLESVISKLNLSFSKPGDMEGFRKETIERFQEVGFIVRVLTYESNEPGVYPFDIEIVGRTEPLKGGFDWEKQQHAVVNDILDLKDHEKGKTIPFDPSMVHNGEKHKH